MDYESQDKMNSFLRSVFRYKKLLEGKAPKTLLVLEENLLQSRLEDLTTKELFTSVMSWNDYYNETSVTEEIDDEKTMRDVNSYLLSLN